MIRSLIQRPIMLKQGKRKKLKLRFGFDHVLHAFLMSKLWRKWWSFCQTKSNINYFFISAIRRLLGKLDHYKTEEFDLYCIGHSHLDACWLWTKLSTINRAIVTFQQNIEYFEKYPFYTFSQTTPQYYDWIRRLRPVLFQKIKDYEKSGWWEIIGGMWVEPDLNLPNGESLVRQRLYGQLFYLEHFGKIAKIESLEDSFGFNAQLPQILIKSGAEVFWTTKITWNDLTEFPFANFLWRGIDGSEIFTHMFKCTWSVFIALSLYKRTGRKITKPKLVFDSSSEKGYIESQLSNDRVKTCGIFYGLGDGGMGPLREEIELLGNLARGKQVKFCNFEQYFGLLRRECGEVLPIWNDELYLEVHRGVYTTQAKMKKLNRLCEICLRNWEILSSISSIILEYYSYPYQELEKSWKILLFNQFHDILPGSSIQDVYYEQEKEIDRLLQKIKKKISTLLYSILNKYLRNNGLIEKDHAKNYIILFNSLPWERDGFLKIRNKLGNSKDLIFKIKKIPPISFRFVDYTHLSDILEDASEVRDKFYVKTHQEEISIGNSFLNIKINKVSGRLTSILYKKTNREIIRNNDGIGIHIYKEKRHKRPAWDIYRGYTSNKINLSRADNIQIFEDSNQIKTVKISYQFNKTIMDHNISLRFDSDLIEFKTNIETYDKYLFFKVRFPFNLETDILTTEIPYGNIKRKIATEKYYEKGKWEFPSQKYVDISESNIGATILNNSKYGFSSNKNGIYLSLLRTPPRASSSFYSYLDVVPKQERTKYVDIGKNSIEYGLWVHEGDFIESHAWKKGYEYNYPLLFERFDTIKTIHNDFDKTNIREEFKDLLKGDLTFISISNPNIILQAIKSPENLILKYENSNIPQIEDDIILILRLFETSGYPQKDVKIEFNDSFRILKAVKTDLLERELDPNETGSLLIEDSRKIYLKFNKFEIITIKLSILIKK